MNKSTSRRAFQGLVDGLCSNGGIKGEEFQFELEEKLWYFAGVENDPACTEDITMCPLPKTSVLVSLQWVAHETWSFRSAAVFLQCLIMNPPWFWLFWHASEVLTLACIRLQPCIEVPLEAACCSEVQMSYCCFSKHQAPSQSNTNYRVGSSKSASKFQCRSRLFRHEDNCDPPACFTLGYGNLPWSLSLVSTSNTKAFYDLLDGYNQDHSMNLIFFCYTKNHHQCCVSRVALSGCTTWKML